MRQPTHLEMLQPAKLSGWDRALDVQVRDVHVGDKPVAAQDVDEAARTEVMRRLEALIQR